ncbi:MAG TPA: hypothetical protein P5270_01130 [Victivallales bacterium]|nr:hypothetical protein [Victivallales bacterium]HPO91513.1 hypothetical protein [Victivallales bacterium]HRR27943.1 hypothetical protein [Victivallales bacterium]
MKKIKIFFVLCIFSSLEFLQAGTITFKDGTRISEAEIISINSGKIVIRKDKKERTFDINKIESFYETDIGDSVSIPGEFADYRVNISDIKMPEKGIDSKGKTGICEIKYSILRTNSENKRFKVPYFYLFVLTAYREKDGERKIYLYYEPDGAKIKAKRYDEAAILKQVNSFDRRIVNFDDIRANINLKNMGDRELKIELKGIDNREIIAYHLEVWGNTEKITEKDWKSFDHKVGERWWEKTVE